MLDHGQRIHRSADFGAAIRRGRRVSRGGLVMHVQERIGRSEPTRCGFVVSKSVGGSVVRHRVTRQLRHLCHDHYASFAPGSIVVVRALPSAATHSFSQLSANFESILEKFRNGRPRGN
ncbi:ribonuclease P protein component [Antricoccus suffuscus]|uniref:ribonuclease P protein component n=1 Tax=Antricoccus suffuscus TaxID=1629062 RepID=UPI000D076152